MDSHLTEFHDRKLHTGSKRGQCCSSNLPQWRYKGCPTPQGERYRDPWHNGALPENFFDERIAKSYEDKWPDLHTPEMIDPVVDFLFDLAQEGRLSNWGSGPAASPSL